MIHNSFTPHIEVDPQNYGVRIGGSGDHLRTGGQAAHDAALLPVLIGKRKTGEDLTGRASGEPPLQGDDELAQAEKIIDGKLTDHPVLGPADCLRGIGRVVFQNNALSGLVILLALFWNSWIYGTVCLFGVAVSTLLAVFLKADRDLICAVCSASMARWLPSPVRISAPARCPRA